MGLDLNKLRALADLDDASFETMIKTVILSAGGSAEQAKLAVQSAPLLKEKLRHADEKQLMQILTLIGRGKAEKALRDLGR